jgi:hypothetical protein
MEKDVNAEVFGIISQMKEEYSDVLSNSICMLLVQSHNGDPALRRKVMELCTSLAFIKQKIDAIVDE